MHKVQLWHGLGSGVTSLEKTATAALTPPPNLIPAGVRMPAAETNWDGFLFFFFF